MGYSSVPRSESPAYCVRVMRVGTVVYLEASHTHPCFSATPRRWGGGGRVVYLEANHPLSVSLSSCRIQQYIKKQTIHVVFHCNTVEYNRVSNSETPSSCVSVKLVSTAVYIETNHAPTTCFSVKRFVQSCILKEPPQLFLKLRLARAH